MAEINEIDTAKEDGRIKEETIRSQRRQKEIDIELKKMQNDMASQIQQQAGMNPQGYDQQQIIANADSIVQQLAGADASTRKSQLHQLQTEDYILYSVVIQRLEQQDTVARQQATAGAY
jgi:hypothetical protein